MEKNYNSVLKLKIINSISKEIKKEKHKLKIFLVLYIHLGRIHIFRINYFYYLIYTKIM